MEDLRPDGSCPHALFFCGALQATAFSSPEIVVHLLGDAIHPEIHRRRLAGRNRDLPPQAHDLFRRMLVSPKNSKKDQVLHPSIASRGEHPR